MILLWVNYRALGEKPNYILVCISVGVVVYFTAHLLESRYRLLIWLNAIGLMRDQGVQGIGGHRPAHHRNRHADSSCGVLRDILAGEPSVLLRPEIYVTATMAGAAVATQFHALGFSEGITFTPGTFCVFIIRGGAIRFGWTFPVYRAQQDRNPGDVMK